MLHGDLDKIPFRSPLLTLHQHLQAPGKSSLLTGSETPTEIEPEGPILSSLQWAEAIFGGKAVRSNASVQFGAGIELYSVLKSVLLLGPVKLT